MTDKMRYTAFGLTIGSALALPELPVSGAEPDVNVRFGAPPGHLDAPVISTPWLEVKAGQFLLTVDSVGRYYAENGRTIVVEPFGGADEDDIRTFLYASAFAALLQQRGVLALHGSAAVFDGQAAVFAGVSSCGKSSVALALHGRGRAVLADDICAVGLQNGRAVVYPGIPRLCVWADALKTAGMASDGMRPVRRGLRKYSYPVANRFAPAPVPLSHIFLLNRHNRNELGVHAVQGGDKLEKLLQQQLFMESASDPAQHFALCTRIASVRMTQIQYARIPGDADKAADVVEREMGV